MSSQAAEQNRELPFVVRLLSALNASSSWKVQASLAVEAWVHLGGASAAILISASTGRSLDVVSCRTVAGNPVPPNWMTIEHSFGVLLDHGATVEILAELGLLSGLQIQVHSWRDLSASIVVQNTEAPETLGHESFTATLALVSRRLLANATDRSILIPDPRLLEAMAEFAAGAGHEINNPLASILGQTQLLLKNEQAAEKRQPLETIGAQAWRIRDMIGNAMLFARPPKAVRKKLSLIDVVRETLEPLVSDAADSGIELRLSCTSDSMVIEADRTQISTLVAHLVRNSIEAMRAAERTGEISVTLQDGPQGCVELSVVDDGPGIVSEEVRRHLFNPFYSGRSAGRGLGFGLCLAWRIVQMHEGMIFYETSAAGGAAFHVGLPAEASLQS